MTLLETRIDYAGLAGPYPLASGDLNNDGKQDIVIGEYNTGSVEVWLGDGSGGFISKTQFAAGNQTDAIVIEDLNNDGNLDISSANRDETISVLLGNGTGYFSPQKTFSTGITPYSMAAGDFNNDGIMDLSASGSGTLSVLLGKGDGSYYERVFYQAGLGGSQYDMAVADFNNDGKLDVVTPSNNSVAVLLGNGDGTFQQAKSYATGINPSGVAAGDLNNDGLTDLVVPNWSDNEGISVLLGKEDGTFQPQMKFATFSGFFGVTLADLNGDGNLDVGVTDVSTDTVSVLLGNGSGQLEISNSYDTGADPWYLEATDLNGDGQQDLALANYASGSLSVLLQPQPNQAPVVQNAVADQEAQEDTPFSLTIDPDLIFSDADQDDSLTISVSELPKWLSYDANTLTFSGTPGYNTGGTVSVTLTATDEGEASISDTFEITVADNPGETWTGTRRANAKTGTAGQDELDGQGGDDLINGAAGSDKIDGGKGDDTLTGAQGDDILKTGAGQDILVFGAEIGRDKVSDFELGVDCFLVTEGNDIASLQEVDTNEDGSLDATLVAFTSGASDTVLLKGVTGATEERLLTPDWMM